MPVGLYTGPNTHTGNGVTTVFAYDFKILQSADLKVTVAGVVVTTGFTVSGVGSSGGGSITFSTAPANGAEIVLSRNRAYSRTTDYQRNGSFDEETVDADFDAVVMLIQQLGAAQKRAIKAPESVSTDQVISSADWAVRASKFFGFNASGALALFAIADVAPSAVSAFIATLLDDIDDAAARTTLGALSDAAGAVGTTNLAAKSVTLAKTADLNYACGRLTLTSGTPVTTADVTGATTVYFTPYKGNVITLFDGTDWVAQTFSELSQATADTTKSPAAVANNSNYDVFVWNDSGTLRATRGPAWNSDTARGTGAGTTELELLDGRYVNKVAITNGPAAQRGLYVGTIRSNGSAQITDSVAFRHVWNNYNRAARPLNVVDNTNTWSYSSSTFRQANANTANQLDIVIGLSEDIVSASVYGRASCDLGANNVFFAVGVGVDSSTVNSAQVKHTANNAGVGIEELSSAHYLGFPGIGRHTLRWLEATNGSGTTTWAGDASTTSIQTGINGQVMA